MSAISRFLVFTALLSMTIFASGCSDNDSAFESTGTSVSTTATDTTTDIVSSTVPEPTVSLPTAETDPIPFATYDSSPTLPQLDAQVLRLDIDDGNIDIFDGSIEMILRWNGDIAPVVLNADGLIGSRAINIEGRQRLLALDATNNEAEIVEEFSPRAGQIITQSEGGSEIIGLDRSELLDWVPDTPSLIVDEMAVVFDDVHSGVPGFFLREPDPLLSAAILGPPLASNAVDVGDGWKWEGATSGTAFVRIDASIVDEEVLPSGQTVFVVFFAGSVSTTPRNIDSIIALQMMSGLLPANTLNQFESLDLDDVATLRVAELQGSMRFDPIDHAVESLQSTLTYVVDFGVYDDEGQVRKLSLETKIIRTMNRQEKSVATAFDRSSILGRYSVEPDDAASAVFARLYDFTMTDPTDEEVDPILETIAGIRQDLLGGVAVTRAGEREDDDAAIVVSVATGGEFRGAPFVAEEIASFLSASVPRRVTVSGKKMFRVTINNRKWHLYNDEAYLYIVVGPRELSSRIMSALLSAPGPYLWKYGDCLGSVDDFALHTPYAPFGTQGIHHCGHPHLYEVIHSETLSESLNAKFPNDLNARSQAICAEAFVEFAGATELETVFSLIRYLPDDEEWAKGSRYLACVVSFEGAEGPSILTERIDGRDEAYRVVYEVGMCLSKLLPVACDDPHDREIIAMFEVSSDPGVSPPETRDLEQEISGNCRDALESFELGDGPGSVQMFEYTDMFTFWEHGSRSYYCMAVVFSDDGLPFNIIGRLGDSWEEAAERLAA